MIVKSPGVSRYRPEVAELERRGVQVTGGLGLWMEGVDRSRVLCVTGTKGKSTTVSIIGHLMAGLDQHCFVGGNLGIPPYDPAAPAEVDWWVIETSSYQVTDLWSAPPTVAVTSLHPDHLDWHGTAERYYADKLALCRLPGVRRAVVNGTDPLLRARSSALGESVEWITPPATGTPEWVQRLGLLGRHNVTNALIARACMVALGVPGADDERRLTEAASGFGGLPARLRTVGVVEGVRFVDDGLSTNVLPTLAALEAFADARVALIVGGFDRGIDYTPLATALAARSTPTMVLTVPDVGDRIGARDRRVRPSRSGDGGALRRRGRCRPRRVGLGRTGRHRAALARRAQLRPLPRLHGAFRGVCRRHGKLPMKSSRGQCLSCSGQPGCSSPTRAAALDHGVSRTGVSRTGVSRTGLRGGRSRRGSTRRRCPRY